MDDTVEIKSSPDENSTSLFVLHEGTKVYIKETFEDWAEIKIADGNTGWIKIKSIERI
jgi:SH3-like domain-containing protein